MRLQYRVRPAALRETTTQTKHCRTAAELRYSPSRRVSQLCRASERSRHAGPSFQPYKRRGTVRYSSVHQDTQKTKAKPNQTNQPVQIPDRPSRPTIHAIPGTTALLQTYLGHKGRSGRRRINLGVQAPPTQWSPAQQRPGQPCTPCFWPKIPRFSPRCDVRKTGHYGE